MTRGQQFIVYRDELLAGSETFILAQSESLPHFQPFYVGLRRRPGLILPETRVHIISSDGFAGKLQRARFRQLGLSRRLQSTLAAKHPVLIHAHFGPDGCNAISVAQALNIPLVVTLHGYDVTVKDDMMPRRYIKRRHLLQSHAARFICVSEFIRQQAIAKGFPAEKTLVHYTGVDIAFFNPRPMADRSPVILFVGRLVPKKGCEYLIRAMARVQEVMPNAVLVIIGDGPLRQALERQASSVLKAFHFLGAQAPLVVKDWMNRAMVFSTPSVIADSGDAEGFGMVFAEAQAMGLPVVSFASGGIPEAVAQDRTGFLVADRDCDALANKLLLLLQDACLWNRLSQAGQENTRRLFDIRKQAAALEDIYESTQMGWDGAVARAMRAAQRVTQIDAPGFQAEPRRREKYLDGPNAGVALSSRK